MNKKNPMFSQTVLGLLAGCGLMGWMHGATCQAGNGELVHRWSFNGNYTDSVGGVTATQGGSASWVNNQAVKLPGGNRGTGWVELGSNILPDDGSPVTLEMWATLDSVQSWGRVFDYGYDNQNYVLITWNYTATDKSDRIELRRRNSSLLQRDNTITFEVGVKYHIAVTFMPQGDGSTTIRYMRRNATTGVLERECFSTVKDWTLAELSHGHVSPFWLGHSQFSSDKDAAATYDEVRVWRGLLNDTQLSANAVLGPDTLPAVADCTPRPTLRIMPVGDSITEGAAPSPGAPGGYRLPLYHKLAALGYNVDYVGGRTATSSPDLPDWDHLGYGGWRITHPTSGISENIRDWMGQVEPPDVVLIHLGTNDTNDKNFENRIERMGKMIDMIAAMAPNAHIVLGNIIKRTDNATLNNKIETLFNPYVPQLVQSQVAKGQKVHFLDLYTLCPPETTLSTDKLHPNVAGYAVMADAWITAITNIFPTAYGDTAAPAMARVTCSDDGRELRVTYGKPVVDATIAVPANYTLTGVEGVTVTAATADGDGRAVNLKLSAAVPRNTDLTLAVTGVSDRCSPVHTGSSSFVFRRPYSRDYRDNVPKSEWEQYAQVYAFDIPASGVFNQQIFESVCGVNRAAEMAKGFDRVAYYVELKRPGTELEYVWVSMDAFTDDVKYIGVPTFANGRVFQQKVANMNVFCNVPGVVNGTGITTGNIEFWPNDYTGGVVAGNALGGDGAVYDFDDTRSAGGAYGSMQVHNWGAKQTIFAYNLWNDTKSAPCVGIGNFTAVGGHPDWTLTANGGLYSIKRMQIFVRYPADTTAPTVTSVEAMSAGTQMVLRFSEKIAAGSLENAVFTATGFTVTSMKLLDDGQSVLLGTTAIDPEVAATLKVAGVRDLAGNAIDENAAPSAVRSYTVPAQVRADVGDEADGYELVYVIDVPVTANFVTTRNAYLVDQSEKAGAFDRVAYYVEFYKAEEPRKWIWTSCDAFTQHRKMLDVPVGPTAITYQRQVYNTIIKSNVGLAGDYPRGCNLEFWSCSYGGGPAGVVPNAPATGYAWDDAIGANCPLANGYGSMQFHCYGASVPLWGINNFGTDGSTIGLGYGSSKDKISGHLNDCDWTFSQNAGQFATRRIHVFVRPAAASRPTGEQVESEVRAQVGDAAFGSFKTLFAIDQLPSPCSANTYQWRLKNRMYAIDRRSEFATNKIKRVAYYMQLQKAGQNPVWIWTAMDNFATDVRHLGVPEGGYTYQSAVAHLTVKSNSSAVTQVDDCATGCVEFWSSNYGQTNSGNNWGGNTKKYDWNDSGFNTGVGYGSMQVHNYGASQVLWAFNNFNNGATPCIGIGNNTTSTGDPDWTFNTNAGEYTVRKLYCFVIAEEGDRADAELNAFSRAAAKVGAATMAGYQLLFAADNIPVACTCNNWEWMHKNFYQADHRSDFAPGGFDRVAYFMELQKSGQESVWVWTAMDPICANGMRHGVPYGGYYFKQNLTNLDVRSNSPSVTEVTGHNGGCVEYWATNYGGGNGGKCDCDDSNYGTGTGGYGSMQVHNKSANQTLWAFNAFNNGAKPCLGIGNNTTGTGDPDWTFNQNADQYTVRRLYCFVRPCTPPVRVVPAKANSIVRAIGSTDGDKVTVRFATALTTMAMADAVFTLDHGVKVKKVTLVDSTHVVLHTTAFAPGVNLALSVTGLKDEKGIALGVLTATATVPTVAQATLPADIAAAVPALAGYRLVQRLEIPQYGKDAYQNTPYCVDESYYGGIFDRVAYILDETPSGGAREWVYAAMDAFTGDATKIGLPVYERGAMYQQEVANLDVAASANANVTIGTGIATGCIEFWPQSYSEPTTLASVGGQSAIFDWNDTPSSFGTGHGSMQVHNWGVGETVLAVNNFGGNVTDQLISGGIGNCPKAGTKNSKNSLIAQDWTFSEQAYSARTLYVLVREVQNPVSDGKGPAIFGQPQSTRCDVHESASFTVYAPAAAAFQWYRNGQSIAGATEATLCIEDAGGSDVGVYSVMVVGVDGGCTFSASARLVVTGRGTLMLIR